MEDLFRFAISGVYLLVLFSLTFNFVLARRMHSVEKRLSRMNKSTEADFEQIGARLKVLKEIEED